jgi:hypothetical protein
MSAKTHIMEEMQLSTDSSTNDKGIFNVMHEETAHEAAERGHVATDEYFIPPFPFECCC